MKPRFALSARAACALGALFVAMKLTADTSAATVCAGADENLLWFDAPAKHFTESCPLGNGRLGAMVFGGVAEERIVLNETGMWSGSPPPRCFQKSAACASREKMPRPKNS